MAGQTAAAGGPTWRDLVDNTRELTEKIDHVEENLGSKIDEVAETLGVVKDSLLPRVAVLEEASARHTRELGEHEGRLVSLETAHNRAIGHIGAWKVAGSVIAGASAIVVADLVAKLIGA